MTCNSELGGLLPPPAQVRYPTREGTGIYTGAGGSDGLPLSKKGVLFLRSKETSRQGQFLRDCAAEAWRGQEVPHNTAWQQKQGHHKEFARWHDWVRRVLEECCWWELNENKRNINSHLQLRLTNLYLEALSYRMIGDKDLYIPTAKRVEQEGKKPKQNTWEEWYRKRATDADLWYKHWTSHIIAVSSSGEQTNVRTMRIRDMWQLFANGRG